MAFKLQKRQKWLFLPVIVLELGMGYILDYLNIHPLWLGLILILIAVFLAASILWGKAIFHFRFYRNYYIEEVGVITPTEKQLERIFPKQEPKGRIIIIPNHKEKVRIRKKRFEL